MKRAGRLRPDRLWPVVIAFLAGFTTSTWLTFAVLEVR